MGDMHDIHTRYMHACKTSVLQDVVLSLCMRTKLWCTIWRCTNACFHTHSGSFGKCIRAFGYGCMLRYACRVLGSYHCSDFALYIRLCGLTWLCYSAVDSQPSTSHPSLLHVLRALKGYHANICICIDFPSVGTSAPSELNTLDDVASAARRLCGLTCLLLQTGTPARAVPLCCMSQEHYRLDDIASEACRL